MGLIAELSWRTSRMGGMGSGYLVIQWVGIFRLLCSKPSAQGY